MARHLANIHIPQFRASDFEILNGDWDLDEVGKSVSAKLPGYKPTSTFLSTLRSNLQLSATGTSPSLPASAISTPTTNVFSHAPPPRRLGASPLSMSTLAYAVPVAMSSTSGPVTEASGPDRTDPIPDLVYRVAALDSPERLEALKLVADSVAQQRQIASSAIILHPATLSAAVLLAAILSRYLDITVLLTTMCGILMAGLVTVRRYTAPYILHAEKIGFKWLDEHNRPPSPAHSRSNSNSTNGNGSGNGTNNRDPVVLVAKWGEETIGALVLRVRKRERKGYVRAWTVKLKYRNKGVGRGLLEEGAKVVWGKGGRGMVFEEEHANSERVLPEWLNGSFERREVRAREVLAEVVAETRKERASR